MKTRKGFTLIELLVVIAILGLLAALLFPVFVKVRERVRQTACASNLHQVGLALKMYQGDWGDLPPRSLTWTTEPHPQGLIPPVWSLVRPYVQDERVFHCPDETSQNEKLTGYLYCNAPFRVLPGVTFAPPLKAEPGTVVALCYKHRANMSGDSFALDKDGGFVGDKAEPFIVVREDGSTARFPWQRVERWLYQNDGTWIAPGGSRSASGSTYEFWRFPGEPWPPTFER